MQPQSLVENPIYGAPVSTNPIYMDSVICRLGPQDLTMHIPFSGDWSIEGYIRPAVTTNVGAWPLLGSENPLDVRGSRLSSQPEGEKVFPSIHGFS